MHPSRSLPQSLDLIDQPTALNIIWMHVYAFGSPVLTEEIEVYRERVVPREAKKTGEEVERSPRHDGGRNADSECPHTP